MLAELAVATSFSTYAKSFPSSCGIVKWCYSAAALVGAPFLAGKAELVVFTNDEAYVRLECGAQPRIIAYDEALVRAAALWSGATNRSRPEPRKSGMPSRAFSERALFKWEVLRHTEYKTVFMTDIDVDLFFATGGRLPPPGSRPLRLLERAWTRAYEDFRRSEGTQLVGSPDFVTPINTGVLMVKPTASTYELGLSVLRTRRWNVQHGFNFSGAPRDVIRLDQLPKRTMDAINGTLLLQANHWAVTGGDTDQGLFAYVFLGLLRGAGFRPSGHRLEDGSRPAAFVNHFWGGSKPWLKHGECRKYFDFMRNGSDFRHRSSPCMGELQARLTFLAQRRAKMPKPCYTNGGPTRVF